MNKVLLSLITRNNRRYLTTKFFSYDVTGKSVNVNAKMKLVTIDGSTFKIATNGALVK